MCVYLFLDESGSFAFPPAGKPGFACIGALVVPEARLSLLLHEFGRLRQRWIEPGAELKGSKLNEGQIARVIDLLLRHRAVYFVTGTLISGLTPEVVREGQLIQAAKLTGSLTPAHQPTLVQQMRELRDRMEAMAASEFVQFVLLNSLVEQVLRRTLVYFSVISPRDLGRYLWKVDAKNQGRSSYEICWSKLGAGLLQTAFLKRPVFVDRRADFRDHDAAYRFKAQEWPDHLPRHALSGTGTAMDLGAMLRESFAFVDSRLSPGIQLADIVTNAFRRALMGNLQLSGWNRLGELLLCQDGRAVDLIHLPRAGDGTIPELPVDWHERVTQIDRLGRSID